MTTPGKSTIDSLTQGLEGTRLENHTKSQTMPAEVGDIDLLSDVWSPEDHRLSRTLQQEFKVRNIKNGAIPLMGGDWVLDGQGKSATLSFAFKGPIGTSNETKLFGLTVGHIAERLDDPIYAFASDVPNPQTGKYRVMKIGTVVAICLSTDSLIVEFAPQILVEPYKIHLGGPTPHQLVIPDWSEVSNTSPLQIGTAVVAFGAQRRGAKGVVAGRCAKYDGLLDSSDICFEASDPRLSLSDEGDCGMIYIDERGIPWAIHHTITRHDGVYFSWGKSLAVIMSSHYQYFGIEGRQGTAMHQLGYISPPVKADIPQKSFSIEFLPGEEPKASIYSGMEVLTPTRNMLPYIGFPME